MDEKQPLYDIHTEKSILCSMILEDSALHMGLEHIKSEEFYASLHRDIFSVISNLTTEEKGVDMTLVYDGLTRVEKHYEINEAHALAVILEYETIATSPNIGEHIKIVKEYAKLRNLETLATKIQKNADQRVSSELIVRATDNFLQTFHGNSSSKGPENFKALLGPSIEVLDDMSQKGGLLGINTGIDKLNTETGGLVNSDFIVIAGRPGSGKTSLLRAICLNAWNLDRAPGLLFSLEMSKTQLMHGFLSMDTEINLAHMRSGRMSGGERARLSKSASRLYEADIYIDDDVGLALPRLRTVAKRAVSRYGVRWIGVDYLQLMEGEGENRNLVLSGISRGLKKLAKSLDIPVIALSQLSRDMEKGHKVRPPRLSDLRESGAIEQDADMVLFCFRPYEYDKSKDPNEAYIIIGKQRQGPVGTIKDVRFLSHCAKWVNKPPDGEGDFGEDPRPGSSQD